MSYTIKQIAKASRKVWSERQTQAALNQLRDQVQTICLSGDSPDCSAAEADFDHLLASSKPLPEYGYDAVSNWRRGAERALQLASVVPDFGAVQRSLEVACGDGMTSVILAAHGLATSTADLRDWRDPRAAKLPFKALDIDWADPLPAGGSPGHDLVFSYNAFEHFGNPATALSKMLAVTRPGGHLFFEFGPLYAGPWGLHAYRMIPIPYMQFLFSEPFWRDKLRQTGVRDLGQDLDELQPLNGWTVAQFENLWADSGCEIVLQQRVENLSQLALVSRYPGAFRGRGLTVEDLSTQALRVLLRKPGGN
ncbi:MAG: methyltransferase domain-containing protein [Burkholderiaceae bacterium]|nr:methyltransferase domain-containing protein [Burkholderiaceae bacterium]